MKNRIATISALALVSTCTDPSGQLEVYDSSLNTSSDVAVRRYSIEYIMKKATRANFDKITKIPAKPIKMDPEQYEPIEDKLTKVNTHAISCYQLNELCTELRQMGIEPTLLKGSGDLFTSHPDSLKSYTAFEERIKEGLQPKEKYPDFSDEARLNRATEVLSRSALGIYQIVYRYWAEEFNIPFDGEVGRKDMYAILTSKKKQDDLAERIIHHLGKKNEWDIVLMAASYYGGPKFVRALKAKRDGSDEFDAFLTEKRYHGYPSVMTYLDGFEGYMKGFAQNEGCELETLGNDDVVRLFRYVISQKESAFNMQNFERKK